MRPTVSCTIGLTVFSLAAAVTCAYAAEADTGPTIEEVVVTAQKRQESEQRVPIAIQVISESQLNASGIHNTNDLPQLVPGFMISSSAANQLYYLRGVGSQQVGTSASSEVSTFVDGVYMPFQTGNLQGFNNIASIEVDKGPQGTLFGRNSTGGVIQINTRDPQHDPTAEVKIGYATYRTVSGSAYVTGGLTEKLAADVAVYELDQRNGYGRNLATHDEVFTSHMSQVRSKWLLSLSEDTKIWLIADYNRVIGDNGSVIRPAKGIGQLYNEVTDGPLIIPGFYNTAQNTRSDHDSTDGGVSAKIQTNLGFAQLTSITAWRAQDLVQNVDFDGAPQTFVPIDVHESSNMTTEELQLASLTADKLTWVAGAFFLRQNGHTHPFEFGSPFASIVFNAPPGETYTLHAITQATSYAGYAQATATVLPDTHLTLGARYTHEQKKIEGYTQAGTFIVPASIGSQTATYSKPTFRAALDYDLTSSFKAYVSFNRGFQAGTFNSNSAGGYTRGANPPLQPENIDAYEVGVKSEWLNRRLRINVSGFYYDYTNLQQQSYVGNVLIASNAGAARIKGIDAELRARPAERFSVGVIAEVLNARFSDYNNAPIYSYALPNGTGPLLTSSGDATGNRLGFAPTFTGTAFGDYVITTPVGTFTTTASVSYNAGYYADPGNLYKEPAFYLINLSEDWALNEKFDLLFWSTNLNNRQYDQSVAAVSPIGFDGNTPGAPREYGVTARYRF